MPLLGETTTPHMPENFWVSLADKGLTIAFMAAAVYFMGKWFLGAQNAKDALYVQRIAEMGTELTQLRERVRSAENQIVEANFKIRECENDRADLRTQMEAMRTRMA